MKDFANLDNSSGSFPDVVGVDASGPGETDGTELTADLFNDIMGAFQAILNDVSVTPSGSAESGSGTSQILDAIKEINKTFVAATCISNWTDTISLAAFAGTVNGLAYGNGYFVAVGDGGNLEYSIDGLSWTANDQGAANFNAVYYANGYWVAVGDSGALYYATDPTGSWTSNTQGSSRFDDVYHDGTYWVAVGLGGTLYYATDPTSSWTSNTQGSSNFYAVYYANGYWVAVGVSGTLYYKATDPTGSWTSNTQGSDLYNDVYYANGYWMICGQNGAFLYKATDPTGSWTTNDPNSSANYGIYSWYKNIVVVGAGGEIFINSSVDGNWSLSQKTSDDYRSICYGNGRLLVGTTAAEVISSLQNILI